MPILLVSTIGYETVMQGIELIPTEYKAIQFLPPHRRGPDAQRLLESAAVYTPRCRSGKTAISTPLVGNGWANSVSTPPSQPVINRPEVSSPPKRKTYEVTMTFIPLPGGM